MSKKASKSRMRSANKRRRKLHNKPAHAAPLAIARQRPENRKENQAGHSSSANKREIEWREWVRSWKNMIATFLEWTWKPNRNAAQTHGLPAGQLQVGFVVIPIIQKEGGGF